MKKLILIVYLILATCASFAQPVYHSPFDPKAARDDLSNVSGAVELTLSQKVKAAWAEITGSATVGAGSAAAPSITTTGDTNTGIYFPGADTIGFAEGGAEAFRVSSTGNVLIGTTTDDGVNKLQVNGNISAGAGSAAAPSITTTGDTDTGIYFPGPNVVGVSVGGAKSLQISSSDIIFGYGPAGAYSMQLGNGRTGNGYAFLDFVGDETYFDYGLRIIRQNTGANADTELVHKGTGKLTMRATEAGAITFNTTNVERMRVTSGGDVGIATTTPQAKLHVVGDTLVDGSLRTSNAGSRVVIAGGVTSNVGLTGSGGENAGIYQGKSGTSPLNFYNVGTGGFRFFAGTVLNADGFIVAQGTEKARLTENGELLLNSTTDAGAYKLQVNGNIFASGIPEYADNAAAKTAGLVDGGFYHTAGVLKVVYTP